MGVNLPPWNASQGSTRDTGPLPSISASSVWCGVWLAGARVPPDETDVFMTPSQTHPQHPGRRAITWTTASQCQRSTQAPNRSRCGPLRGHTTPRPRPTLPFDGSEVPSRYYKGAVPIETRVVAQKSAVPPVVCPSRRATDSSRRFCPARGVVHLFPARRCYCFNLTHSPNRRQITAGS